MRDPKRLIAVLILIALGLRISALLCPLPIDIDEARYLVAAHHLRSGVGYSDWRGPEIDIHPLHPAIVSVLGRSLDSLEQRGRAVTFVCSILFLWPLGALACRLAGSRALAIFLVLAGSHPWLAKAAASVQPESLYVLVTAAGLLALWPEESGDTPTWRWALAGILFGLAYLARPEGILVGLLASGIALFASGGSRVGRLLRAGAFGAALLMFSSPYLIFLWRVTGDWILTGKTTELFFVGQALYDAGGTPPQASTYLALIERWKGVLPYIMANPGVVGLRAASNAVRIGAWTLPAAIGPGGLIGLLGCAFLVCRPPRPLFRPALIISPALTLVLMLLTFRNYRVIGSVLPFLLVLSAAGLSALADRFDLRTRPRSVWAFAALAIMVLFLWLPGAARALNPPTPKAPPDRDAADVALRLAGHPARVASNNPALSFYLRDPALFGPPGRYTPLQLSGSCSDLAEELRIRGAEVAVLDEEIETRGYDVDSDDCPLLKAATFENLAAARRISILTWK